MKKVCFVSLNAYPILARKDTQIAGGAELQLVLIARELVKKGYDVSFVTYDFGQKPLEIINRIKVIKAYKRNNKKRFSRYFYEKKLLFDALKKADADIYHQRSGNYLTGLVAKFCRKNNKKFIFSIAHIWQCKKSFLRSMNLFTRHLYQFGLNNSFITVQTEDQRKTLKKELRKDSILLRNAYFIEDKKSKKKPVILWLNTIKWWKKPETFLELALLLKEYNFEMIGGPEKPDDPYYKRVELASKGIKNLDFKGFVPYHKVDRYVSESSLMINTSLYEGFPNSLLQAWSKEIPVITMNVDPDEVVCKYKLGYHVKDIEEMAEKTRKLMKDKRLREKFGRNSKEYVKNFHDINRIVEEYIKIYER